MEKEKIVEGLDSYNSPLYIFDLDLLKKEVETVKDYLYEANATLCYAMKANPFIIGDMNEYVQKFEVCSPGEYEICARNAIDPEKIVVSGVNKTNESMDRIFELGEGKGVFTAESRKHYDIILKNAKKRNKKVSLLLRLTSGNQFGMDKSVLEEIYADASKAENKDFVEIVGIHYFSGTQKKLKKVEKEIIAVSEYASYIKEKYNPNQMILEYGSGLSVFYFVDDKEINWEEQIREFSKILKEHATIFDHIVVEMGRFITAHCGYYITKVIDTKTNEGTNYAIVDGGIHQINYYGQIVGMKVPFMEHISKGSLNPDEVKKWSIFGSLCTTNDVLVKDVEFKDLKQGDYLVFKNCGAYSVTEGIALFLSRELPAVVTYSESAGFTKLRNKIEMNIFNSNQ